MEYAGWTPPLSGAPHAVDREPAAEMSPRRLYEKYISKRRPVVLTGGLAGTPWSRAGDTWTDAFLLAHPESETRVRVEARAGTDESFGVGKYETMRFRDFVTRFAKGDDTVYLTASPASVDAQGRPEVASAPASFLMGEDRPARVPFRPELAGNLVPANVNLWLGAAGAAQTPSSGLHHDHHDNLYVLLRGEKRFELYAPDAVEAMYPTGTARRVHANGRIDYEETGDYAEDGDDGSLRRRVASIAVRLAEAEVERAQTAVDAGTPGAKTWLRRAETALDTAMDATMGDDDGDDAFELVGFDDFDDVGDSDLEASDASDASERFCDGDGDGRDGRDGDKTCETSRETRTADGRQTDPPSFSRMSLARTSDLDVDARNGFPLFGAARATRRMETAVRAGEILYLPAGWFHEVRSCNVPGKNHAALNYWFHPPVSGAPFETPYGSAQRQDLWERDWAAWEEMRRGT